MDTSLETFPFGAGSASSQREEVDIVIKIPFVHAAEENVPTRLGRL